MEINFNEILIKNFHWRKCICRQQIAPHFILSIRYSREEMITVNPPDVEAGIFL